MIKLDKYQAEICRGWISRSMQQQHQGGHHGRPPTVSSIGASQRPGSAASAASASLSFFSAQGGRWRTKQARRLLPHNNMSEVYCRGGLDPRSRWPFLEALPGERASDLPSVRPTFSLLGTAFSCALQAARPPGRCRRRRRPCHLPHSLTPWISSCCSKIRFSNWASLLLLLGVFLARSVLVPLATLCASSARARPCPPDAAIRERPFLLSLCRSVFLVSPKSRHHRRPR